MNTTIFRNTINGYRLHLSKGNSKTGRVLTFNTLPTGDYIRLKDGRAAVNERGTCAGVCQNCGDTGICYAIKAVKAYPSAAIAWAENTRYMREDANGLINELFAAIIKEARAAYKRGESKIYFRIHSAGEMLTAEEMRGFRFGEIEFWDTLARWCSDLHLDFDDRAAAVHFYTYTKRVDMLGDYRAFLAEQYDSDLQNNFHVNISAGFGITAEEAAAMGAAFLYDDGTEPAAAEYFHCPAVSIGGKSTGITCDACRRCFNAKRGTITAVYAH